MSAGEICNQTLTFMKKKELDINGCLLKGGFTTEFSLEQQIKSISAHQSLTTLATI